MTSGTETVYFVQARGNAERNKFDRIHMLLDSLKLEERFTPGELVAVKVHWGEPGNADFLPPVYVRQVVQRLLELGVRPFVTDSNTLYRGGRHDAVGNLATAAQHGYTAESLGCPVIIADGLLGTDYREVDVPGKHTTRARVASAIAEADGLVALSHVKGHMVFGFGGALKNLGMGCSPAGSKQYLHADIRPRVKSQLCTGCETCFRHCHFGAITLHQSADGRTTKASINPDACSGCGECVGVCPEEAIPISWGGSARTSQEKTAEYAWAAVQGKQRKTVFINYLLNVTPDCDCCSWSDAPIVADQGTVGGFDPVAVDVASIDLIMAAPSLRPDHFGEQNRDHFRDAHDIDYRPILEHAQHLGLGTMHFRVEAADEA